MPRKRRGWSKKSAICLAVPNAGKTIAVLGLTFKPETDDMREAPAVTILPALLEKGARIKAHDPKGMEEARKFLPPEVEYAKNAYDACENADAVILMTEWNQYRALDLEKIRNNPENAGSLSTCEMSMNRRK